MTKQIIRIVWIATAFALATGCSNEDEGTVRPDSSTNARGVVRTLDGGGLSDVEITFVSASRNVSVGRTRADGRYSVSLGAGGVPSGSVEFRKAGYVSGRISFPEAFTYGGDNWYESDVLLTTVPTRAP